MAVEDPDDVVASNRGEQCLTVLVAPPVRCAAAGVSRRYCADGSQRSSENLSQTVVLEQDDGPAVSGMGGEVLLRARGCRSQRLGSVASEAVHLHEVQPPQSQE